MAALSSPAPGHRWMAVSGWEGLPRMLGWALIPHSSIVGCTVTQDFSSTIHCFSRVQAWPCTHTNIHKSHAELCSDTDWWKNACGWSSVPHITRATTQQQHSGNVDELLFYTSLIQQNCIDLCQVWLHEWNCFFSPELSEKVTVRAIILKSRWEAVVAFYPRLRWHLLFKSKETIGKAPHQLSA